jgi:hypothetical protein
MQGSKST